MFFCLKTIEVFERLSLFSGSGSSSIIVHMVMKMFRRCTQLMISVMVCYSNRECMVCSTCGMLLF